MAMRVGRLQQEVLELLQSITPEMVMDAATIGAEATAACFAARTLYVAIGRACGFYSPTHYHLFPRLPWRIPYKIWIECKKWYERIALIGKRGSTGGFANLPTTLTMMFKPGYVLLGRAKAFELGIYQPVGIKPQRHLFMLAMTGSGKTALLKSIISTYKGSVSLIDPDYNVTDDLMARDHRQWAVLAPYRQDSACFNAYDCIKEAMEREGPDAAVLWSLRIAEALIITPSGSRSPYFFDVSKQYLAGLILHILTTHPASDHHLPYTRDLIVQGYKVYDDQGNEITKDDEAQQLLLRSMMKNPAYEGAIAGAAAAMASASGETGGNVRSTLQDQTKFLDIPDVRRVLRSTTIPLSQLKTRNDVVFAFAAPLFSIREELNRLSRLITNTTAYIFEAVKQKKGQTLVCVDELPSQQYNPIYEVILAAGRSKGMTLLGIAQNIEQMRKNDPQNYKTFIGESDAVYWMGGNHPENAALLSDILAKTTIVEKDKYSGRKNYREVDVATPEQCKRYLDPNDDNLIVTRAGGRPLRLKIEFFFRALPVWRYAPSQEHKEAFLRRITRFFCDRKPSKTAHQPTPETDETAVEIKPDTAPIIKSENVIPFPNERTTGDMR